MIKLYGKSSQGLKKIEVIF